MDSKTPPAGRTPGVPPFGSARQGPLGPRPVLPDKAQALSDMTQAAKEMAENPPPEDPVPDIPEQKRKDDMERVETPKEPVLPSARSVFDEIEQLANLGTIKDSLFAKRMQYLDCKERRETIEARCTDLDFNEYIVRGELRQEVYIWGPPESKRPSVVYRTISMEDEIIARQFLSGDFSTPLVSDVAQCLLMLTAGVISIGQLKLPEFPSKGGIEDRKKTFKERLELLIKQPFVVIWDLYINYLWFQGRVREALYGSDADFR